MTFRKLRYLWYTDLYRYEGRVGLAAVLQGLLLNPGFPGYTYTFYFRLAVYLSEARPRFLMKLLSIPCRLLLNHYMFKFGISIPRHVKIGSGFYIGHFGGIVVNEECVIGKNCNISQGVTLGQANRGRNKGCPTIGDNVYIGPGVKIVGAVHVGDYAAIGANCVVTHNVPEHAVVVGVPDRVISYEGSEEYVNYTDYEEEEIWHRR